MGKSISDKINDIMTKEGLTQVTFAHKIGASHTSVSNYIHGYKPKRVVELKILEYWDSLFLESNPILPTSSDSSVNADCDTPDNLIATKLELEKKVSYLEGQNDIYKFILDKLLSRSQFTLNADLKDLIQPPMDKPK